MVWDFHLVCRTVGICDSHRAHTLRRYVVPLSISRMTGSKASVHYDQLIVSRKARKSTPRLTRQIRRTDNAYLRKDVIVADTDDFRVKGFKNRIKCSPTYRTSLIALKVVHTLDQPRSTSLYGAVPTTQHQRDETNLLPPPPARFASSRRAEIDHQA